MRLCAVLVPSLVVLVAHVPPVFRTCSVLQPWLQPRSAPAPRPLGPGSHLASSLARPCSVPARSGRPCAARVPYVCGASALAPALFGFGSATAQPWFAASLVSAPSACVLVAHAPPVFRAFSEACPVRPSLRDRSVPARCLPRLCSIPVPSFFRLCAVPVPSLLLQIRFLCRRGSSLYQAGTCSVPVTSLSRPSSVHVSSLRVPVQSMGRPCSVPAPSLLVPVLSPLVPVRFPCSVPAPPCSVPDRSLFGPGSVPGRPCSVPVRFPSRPSSLLVRGRSLCFPVRSLRRLCSSPLGPCFVPARCLLRLRLSLFRPCAYLFGRCSVPARSWSVPA